MRDEPNQHERGYLPDVVGLEIPMQSVMNLRRVADALRGLATRLDYLSRYPDPKVSVTMIEAYMAIRDCNRAVTTIRSRGRPKRSRHKF